MRILGAKELAKQIKAMPKGIERNLVKSVRSNTEQAAKLARALVPVASGQLRAWIFTQYDSNGLRGAVEAAPPTKQAQTKANAVEFGRTKGDRGKTAAQPYIRIAQKSQARKFSSSIRSAVRRGMKEATSG